MNSMASKNQGVRIIASFEDRAIALNTSAGMDRSGQASRSANEGIHLFATFEDGAHPLNGVETGTRDALSTLFAQHEQNVQKLVNKLQGTIDELKKENADLKGILLERDRLLDRYYLNGPNEDDI